MTAVEVVAAPARWPTTDMIVETAALTAVKRGYAYVVQNERGHFFSEGNYDILGAPTTDGDDALTWMAKQAWSNGKVGTTGCSSQPRATRGAAARRSR